MLKLNRITGSRRKPRMDVSVHFQIPALSASTEMTNRWCSRLMNCLLVCKPCSGSMVLWGRSHGILYHRAVPLSRSVCTASIILRFSGCWSSVCCWIISHAWNMMKVNRSWMICCWGSGAVHGKRDLDRGMDFDDHIEWCFLRILLRHPMCLLFIRQALRFPTRNGKNVSRCWKAERWSSGVVVVQDENSYPWSNPHREFEAGYVISNSCDRVHIRMAVSKTQFQLQPRIVWMQTRLHHRFRLKYLLLFLILTSLILVSTAVFSTTLDIYRKLKCNYLWATERSQTASYKKSMPRRQWRNLWKENMYRCRMRMYKPWKRIKGAMCLPVMFLWTAISP